MSRLPAGCGEANSRIRSESPWRSPPYDEARWTIEIGLVTWSESPSYRDFVARFLDPAAPEGVPRNGLIVDRVSVEAARLFPIRAGGTPILFVGPVAGWSDHREQWRDGAGPSGASRRQFIGGLRLAVPIAVPRIGSVASLHWRRGLATLKQTDPASLSTSDGFSVFLQVPLGAGRGTTARAPTGGTPFALGLRYGIPLGIIDPFQTGPMTGIAVRVPMARGWTFQGSVSNFDWRLDSERIAARGEPYLAPASVVPAEWAAYEFQPEGRTWEVTLGVHPPLFRIRAVPLTGAHSGALARHALERTTPGRGGRRHLAGDAPDAARTFLR